MKTKFGFRGSVSSAERRLTAGDQSKDDMANALAPYANWVQQITPVPMAVASLAQLAVLSTAHVDFKLIQPVGGFKSIKYPDSFKASLMQVSNEGYEAFNLSHIAMDEIRLTTLNIPGDMKMAVEILIKGTDREVEVNLAKVLNSIESAADTCLERSNDVVAKYESVRKLVDELLETGMSTKGASEDKKEMFELQRENQQKKERFFEQEKKMLKGHLWRPRNSLTREIKSTAKLWTTCLEAGSSLQ